MVPQSLISVLCLDENGGSKASGIVVVNKLPNVGEEEVLYKVKKDYIDDEGKEVKRGIYSWDDTSSSFTFVAGATFVDWTDELKNNSWNKSHGSFDTTNNLLSLFEINGRRFLTCKYVFNDPLLDISEPNKVLELPFTFNKNFKFFIGMHTHQGDKYLESMRHSFFDPDGAQYIDPHDYEVIQVPVKDLLVEEISGDLYAHQMIDAKGDLIYTNNFMSNVAPWLEYNEVDINAHTPTEVNKVKRPYACAQQWVELELTTDPAHRYDQIPVPKLQNGGAGSMQYRYMFYDTENEELWYGFIRYNYKSGNDADKTYDAIGDFYLATDTMKIYRWIQNLYKTEKVQFKVNADFMYNQALMNAGCRVMTDAKLARMISTADWDEDWCISPTAFDGTYQWIPDDNYGGDTGGMADVIGNSIYFKGAIDWIEINGVIG